MNNNLLKNQIHIFFSNLSIISKYKDNLIWYKYDYLGKLIWSLIWGLLKNVLREEFKTLDGKDIKVKNCKKTRVFWFFDSFYQSSKNLRYKNEGKNYITVAFEGTESSQVGVSSEYFLQDKKIWGKEALIEI